MDTEEQNEAPATDENAPSPAPEENATEQQPAPAGQPPVVTLKGLFLWSVLAGLIFVVLCMLESFKEALLSGF